MGKKGKGREREKEKEGRSVRGEGQVRKGEMKRKGSGRNFQTHL